MKKHIYLSLILIPALCSISLADGIIMKEGQSINGRILAEKPESLYIDIGPSVIAIAKKDILRYEYTQLPEHQQSSVVEMKPETAPACPAAANRLYHTARGAKIPIEKCVEIVSEAVVKINTPAGMGSGFFINKQGWLITNYHVIEKETRIEVTVFQKSSSGFEKKKFKKVSIKAINPFLDLALLKVEELNETVLKYVPLAENKSVTSGEKVFALGNPLGLERTVTDGVISNPNRAFEGLVYIQTNTDINPGNSGGPLFNLSGEVIGVTNMGYIFYGGLGFAIPIEYVKHFIQNRDAFAYDRENPNTGYKYIQPSGKNSDAPPDAYSEPDKQEASR